MDEGVANFHLDEIPASEYVASSYGISSADDSTLPASMAAQNASFPQECDFLTLITAISTVYSCGKYMEMAALNDFRWEVIGGGNDFLVSRPIWTTLEPYAEDDDLDANYLERSVLRIEYPINHLRHQFVIKRVKTTRSNIAMRPKDMALFIRELSILHHLREHNGIARLLGVGWFYDCLEDAELTPCPKPALLIEEAQGTLEWLLKRSRTMTFLVEMEICSDIASGLLALHNCRLMHGDVKPANVLVFPQRTINEGVEVPRFRCKISDFSLARVVGAEDSYFSGGTPLYMAPEKYSKLSPEKLLLTDVWSLGVLFAQVTERELDLELATDKPELMESMIRQSIHNSMQSSTWDSGAATLRFNIMNDTVQQDANKRQLYRVV